MKQIPPIPLKDKYWRDIQREIERIFNEVLFIPLFKAADIKVPNSTPLKNSPSTPLEKAIAEGKVWYDGEHFKGTYNAAISKELREMGAEFLPKSKWWRYAEPLPAGVSLAIATAAARFQSIRQAVISTLSDLNIASIDNLGDLPEKYSKTIKWIDDDWQKAVEGITVSPVLTDEEQNMISLEYSHDLTRYIKDWSEETILELRQEVQEMVYAGQRPDAIARLIETKYGQSKRKAMFLAKQETGLLMSSYHRARAKDVGAKRWVWVSMDDERTRPEHKLLDGKIFPIDEPPVENLKTGERAFPGQPFGCRCTMKFLVE